MQRKEQFQSHSTGRAPPRYPNQNKMLQKNSGQYHWLTDTKILKILGDWIQQYLKMIIHHNQELFIPGMQGVFNIHKNQRDTPHLKNWIKTVWSSPNRCRKSFWQKSTSTYDKISPESGHRRNISQRIWQTHS